MVTSTDHWGYHKDILHHVSYAVGVPIFLKILEVLIDKMVVAVCQALPIIMTAKVLASWHCGKYQLTWESQSEYKFHQQCIAKGCHNIYNIIMINYYNKNLWYDLSGILLRNHAVTEKLHGCMLYLQMFDPPNQLKSFQNRPPSFYTL